MTLSNAHASAAARPEQPLRRDGLRGLLGWHFSEQAPLRLMPASTHLQLPAYIVALDFGLGVMDVVCAGPDARPAQDWAHYRMCCGNPDHGEFLMEGRFLTVLEAPASWRLSMPEYGACLQPEQQWAMADMPEGHVVFRAADGQEDPASAPVLGIGVNEVMLRWSEHPGAQHLEPGQVTLPARLTCAGDTVPLGCLKVAQVLHSNDGWRVAYRFSPAQPDLRGI